MSCSGCARRRAAIKAVVAGLALWPLRALAHGAPGENPDAPMAEWYRGLTFSFRDPAGVELQGSCCGAADCHTYGAKAVRSVSGKYQVFGPATAPDSAKSWMTVLDSAVLRIDNPTGYFVACIAGSDVLCFIPPTMS